jgi:carboxypeptidase C (cathepsin A)
MIRWSLVLIAVVLCVAVAPMEAQNLVVPDGLVTTHHQVVVDGKTLKYTATAGRLPIINAVADETHGYMFFVAYTLDRAPSDPARPLTFVWNGGPGSSASQVQLMGFGPRRLKMGASYPTSAPLSVKTDLEDNQETWLDFTDLVFVDPIGTGYSRLTKPEYTAEFFNTVGDAESVAEFIRVYRQRFDAFNAPLFLAGESYGTTRAQWVAEALERRRTTVAGVALISGEVSLGQKPPPAMWAALLVSRFTATAYYHQKLPADLQSGTLEQALKAANSWARTEYASALDHPENITKEQRDTIIAQLVRFSGVKPKVVDPRTLMISGSEFTDRLLEDQGLDLGRYDSRMTARRDVAKIPWTPTIDPSLSPVIDLMQGTSPSMIRYLRSDLKYKTDQAYLGPFGGAYPAPTIPNGDWMSTNWARGGNQPAGVPAYEAAPGGGRRGGTSDGQPASIPLIPPLRKAMELNPSMHVLVLTGLYDSIGCERTAYSFSLIDPPFRDRVKAACYVGGHMMYSDKEARQHMKHDMAELVREGSGS